MLVSFIMKIQEPKLIPVKIKTLLRRNQFLAFLMMTFHVFVPLRTMPTRVLSGVFSSSNTCILVVPFPVQFRSRDLNFIDGLTLLTMADDVKLQQSLQESSVLDTPKNETRVETEDYFPAPPVSPERSDLWSEQRWKNTLSKEELKQRCSRCKEIGHGYQHCPYPIIFVTVSDSGGGPDRVKPVVWQPPKGKYRCSRCGRRGHNRRTCHGPVFY